MLDFLPDRCYESFYQKSGSEHISHACVAAVLDTISPSNRGPGPVARFGYLGKRGFCANRRQGGQRPFRRHEADYEALPVHAAPKFLGTYEMELHGCIERAIELAPRYILNVGCAEGFYAVGFAMRLPDSQIFAADADPKALRATLRNAKLNNVQSRVYGVGIVKPRQFDTYLKPDASLLVMDCEGAEFTLLNPDNDPILLRTHILVEVHPEFGSELDIIARFTQTHRPKTINQISRSEPATRPIPGIDFVRAADERRGRDRWVFLECIDQD